MRTMFSCQETEEPYEKCRRRCDIRKTALELHPVQQVYDQREALTELETGLSPAVVPVSWSDIWCLLYFERYISEPFSLYFFGFGKHAVTHNIVCHPVLLTTETLLYQQKYSMFKGQFAILHF